MIKKGFALTALKFETRPFRLLNKIQHYAWGARNEQAFIAKLLQLEVEKDKPYAELWMGTHPNAPSTVEINNQEKIHLDRFIKQFPREVLGAKVIERFGAQLPFLFKVLSAGEALSIQAHPNKEQAAILHKRDPEHYPDDNHKPEIAIALDQLTALVGFRPLTELITILEEFPELNQIRFFAKNQDKPFTNRQEFKLFFQDLMRNSEKHPEILEQILQSMEQKLLSRSNLSERDELYLQLRKRYGTDVGLIFIYLLNLVHLSRGQGVFLKAGVPHAYLKGNIVECMANSDNVVRVGLTPKFKDVQALMEIVTYDLKPVEILDGSQSNQFTYQVPINEFAIQHFDLEPGQKAHFKFDSISILIIINGQGRISYRTGSQVGQKGQSFLLPAALSEVNFKALTPMEIFCAFVPIK